MTQFVIRSKIFGYNDETFYLAGYRIARAFSDEAEARAAYKQLEINAARDFNLNEVESLFHASEVELKQYDDFVFSRCGEHILEENGWAIDDVLPEELNDDDVFEFIQLAHMESFQLLEFEDEVKFYALWSPKEQDWIKQYDECSESLIYAQSPEQLKPYMDHIFNTLEEDELVQKGAIETLTDSPTLFNQIVLTHFGLKYTNDTLSIQNYDSDALFAINSVLKRPVFEMKLISLAELQELEQQFPDGWDE